MHRCPPEARVSLKSDVPQGYEFAETALKHAGYKAMRSEYEMRIEMSERPNVSQLPNGLVFQPYRHDEDLPMFVDVFRNTFSDHYGYVEEPFEKDLAQFRHWFNNDEQFDPSLVVLTVDKELRIAAGCLLGLKEDYRHPGCGLIDIVGVRREYRKRGLAQAMLYQSFASFWDRGLRRVNLSVDGESLTNAVALYEKVGMHIHRSFMSYEKVLREGVELAKVADGVTSAPIIEGFSWPAFHYNLLEQVRNQYCFSVFKLMTGKFSWRLNMLVPKATQDTSYDQKRARSWYRRWRRDIRKWVERNSNSDKADILLLVPDLFMLCVGLIADRRVPPQFKASLVSAAAYVLSPVDLIPEALGWRCGSGRRCWRSGFRPSRLAKRQRC